MAVTQPSNDQVAGQAHSELGEAYGCNLRIRIPAGSERPSLVWRGDSIVLGTRMPRWAMRARLDEDTGTTVREVGFANLRPPLLDIGSREKRSALYAPPVTADAFLAPPFRMKESCYEVYPLSDFGAFYGEKLREPVTCFSMPYRRGGGVCAHACLYMCCAMMSRQNFGVPATHEVSFKAAQLSGEIRRDGIFDVRGLQAVEMERVLESELIGGAAVLEFGRINGKRSREDELRITYVLQQYLRQGLPVVMIVDCGKLYPKLARILRARSPDKKEFAHALVIVGTRFQKRGQQTTPFPEAFVYHDPLRGPYLEKSACELFAAARFDDCPDLVTFLVPVPKGVAVRISDVRTFFILYAERRTGILRPFVSWLMPPNHFSRQISLVAAEDLEGTYFDDLPANHELRLLLRRNLDRFPPWIWAVEMYHNLPRLKTREASAVWLFDATATDVNKSPHGLFGFCQHEAFSCWLRGCRVENVVVRGNLKVCRKRISL